MGENTSIIDLKKENLKEELNSEYPDKNKIKRLKESIKRLKESIKRHKDIERYIRDRRIKTRRRQRGE